MPSGVLYKSHQTYRPRKRPIAIILLFQMDRKPEPEPTGVFVQFVGGGVDIYIGSQ